MIDLKANPFYLDDEAIAWVENTLAAMTTEEKAGQLFCVLFKEAKPEEFDLSLIHISLPCAILKV